MKQTEGSGASFKKFHLGMLSFPNKVNSVPSDSQFRTKGKRSGYPRRVELYASLSTIFCLQQSKVQKYPRGHAGTKIAKETLLVLQG